VVYVVVNCCRHEQDKTPVEKDVAGTWAEQLEAAEQAATVDEYVRMCSAFIIMAVMVYLKIICTCGISCLFWAFASPYVVECLSQQRQQQA